MSFESQRGRPRHRFSGAWDKVPGNTPKTDIEGSPSSQESYVGQLGDALRMPGDTSLSRQPLHSPDQGRQRSSRSEKMQPSAHEIAKRFRSGSGTQQQRQPKMLGEVRETSHPVPPGNLPTKLERRVKRGIRGWFAKYIYSWLPWRKAPTQNLLKMPSGPTDGRLTPPPISTGQQESGETDGSAQLERAIASVRQRAQEDADRNGLRERFSRLKAAFGARWNAIPRSTKVVMGGAMLVSALATPLASVVGGSYWAWRGGAAAMTFGEGLIRNSKKYREQGDSATTAFKKAAGWGALKAGSVLLVGWGATEVAESVSTWWNGDFAAAEEVPVPPAAVADITEAPKAAPIKILNAASDTMPDHNAAHEIANRFAEAETSPALTLKETSPWDVSDSAAAAPTEELPLEDSASSILADAKPFTGDSGWGPSLSEYTVQPGDVVAKTGLDGYIKTQLFTNDSFSGLSSGAKAQFIEAFRDTLAENRNFADQLVTTSGGEAVFDSAGDLVVRAGDTFNPALLKDPKFLEALAQNIAEDQKKYLLPELGGEGSLENLKYRLAVLAGK